MSTQIASRKASDLDPRSLPGQQQFLVREPPLFPDREHYGQGVEHFSERDQGFTNLATLSADLASPSATAFRLPPSSPASSTVPPHLLPREPLRIPYPVRWY